MLYILYIIYCVIIYYIIYKHSVIPLKLTEYLLTQDI